MSVSRLSIIRTICLFLCVHVSLGYKYFQQEIPNGDSVPDPSVPGAIWEGVGHNNANGGGTRNIFGQEFAANEFVSILYWCNNYLIILELFSFSSKTNFYCTLITEQFHKDNYPVIRTQFVCVHLRLHIASVKDYCKDSILLNVRGSCIFPGGCVVR